MPAWLIGAGRRHLLHLLDQMDDANFGGLFTVHADSGPNPADYRGH